MNVDVDLGDSAKLSEEILQDFFADEDMFLLRHKQKHLDKSNKKKNHQPVVLKSIDASGNRQQLLVSQSLDTVSTSTHTTRSQTSKHRTKSGGSQLRSSMSSLSSSPSSPILQHQPHPSPSKKMKKGTSTTSNEINVSNFHRVGHLMHRVSAVKDHSPGKQRLKHVPDDPSGITIQNVKEVQLAQMRDSDHLNNVMQQVVMLHEELGEVILTHLNHRKEVGHQVETINKAYIQLFEEMLGEVLQLQRSKFTFQTKKIEDLELALERAEAQLLLQKEKTQKQALISVELQRQLDTQEEQLDLGKELQREINRLQEGEQDLQSQLRVLELTKVRDLMARDEAHNNTIKKMKLSAAQNLEAQRLVFAAEKQKVDEQRRLAEERRRACERELEVCKDKALMFDQIRSGSHFKRPSAECSTQTEVDPEQGLWDKQDGWILPISGTAVARNRWRRAYQLASCPSCRGVSRFVAEAATLLRQLRRGREKLPESVITGALTRWTIPDEIARFVSNLPRSVQALRPHSLAWTVCFCFSVLDARYQAERDDERLGYDKQGCSEFLVELCLQRLEVRSASEMFVYSFLTSIREHHRQHPLLRVFARSFGLLDDLSASEKRRIEEDETVGSKALARKKKEEMKELNSRARTKLMEAKQREKEQKKDRYVPPAELQYPITNCSLSEDVLSVVLYCRWCLLQPYDGVYARKIQLVKAECGLLRSTIHDTLGPVIDAMPLSMQQQQQQQYGSTPTGFVPLAQQLPAHLCVGAGSKMYVPLDRAVAVIAALCGSFNPLETKDKEKEEVNEEEEVNGGIASSSSSSSSGSGGLTRTLAVKVSHSLEETAVFLKADGHLELPEGQHTCVRHTMRLFSQSRPPSTTGKDLNWFQVYRFQQLAQIAAMQAAEELKISPSKQQQQQQQQAPTSTGQKGKAVRNMYTNMLCTGSLLANLSDDDEEDEGESEDDNVRSNVKNSTMNRLKSKDHYIKVSHGRKTGSAIASSSSSNRRREVRGTAERLIIANKNMNKKTLNNAESATTFMVEVQGVLLDLQKDTAEVRAYREKLHPEVIMADMDGVLQLAAELIHDRGEALENRVKQLFVEGDTNGDGVLSFSEFIAIVRSVVPHFHERVILKMFREALAYGADTEVINPDAFFHVCQRYGVVNLVDVNRLRRTTLSALETTVQHDVAAAAHNKARQQSAAVMLTEQRVDDNDNDNDGDDSEGGGYDDDDAASSSESSDSSEESTKIKGKETDVSEERTVDYQYYKQQEQQQPITGQQMKLEASLHSSSLYSYSPPSTSTANATTAAMSTIASSPVPIASAAPASPAVMDLRDVPLDDPNARKVVRSMKLNEISSKVSAERMKAELKQRREARLKQQMQQHLHQQAEKTAAAAESCSIK